MDVAMVTKKAATVTSEASDIVENVAIAIRIEYLGSDLVPPDNEQPLHQIWMRLARAAIAAMLKNATRTQLADEYERGYFDGELKWVDRVNAMAEEIVLLREALQLADAALKGQDNEATHSR